MILKLLVLILSTFVSSVLSKNQLKECIRETGDRNECLLQQVFRDQLFGLNKSKSRSLHLFFIILFFFIQNQFFKGLKHLQDAQKTIDQEGLEVCIEIYRRELCEIAQSFAENRNIKLSNFQNQSKTFFTNFRF